jgi:hypothetical protein
MCDNSKDSKDRYQEMYPDAPIKVLDEDGFWGASTFCDLCGAGLEPLILKERGYLRLCKSCSPEDE